MDKIPLPDYEVASLDHIATDVRGLRILFVNVFAIGVPAGPWTLIDAGLYLSATRIRHWVESIFGEGAKPQSIILTHGHFDHVGALKDLADALGRARVCAAARTALHHGPVFLSAARSFGGRRPDGADVAALSARSDRYRDACPLAAN